METSDTGLQSILGQTAISLDDFANAVGQEMRSSYPLQNGSDIDIGIFLEKPGGGGPAAASPAPASQPVAQPGAGTPLAADDKTAGNRNRGETVGPFQQKKDYVPTRDVCKFKPDDLRRITPHLARGSFGVVFKGWAKGIPQQVVIKDMEIQSRHSIEEWQKEIKIMAQTKSNYIAEVYGYSNKDKTLTIVMEFMENGDLFGVLHKYPEKHPLSLIQRMRMARHCSLGLQVMHQKKFMHRDIKSMNILVDQDYTCKLTDFGCSKLVNDQQNNNFLHTANTGTPLWMAPEVKRGEYGFASDIYSMGLVLYELFEKKLPNYDPNTSITSLPKSFQSAPVVLPCVGIDPNSRPNIEQVLVQLDKLVRRITEAVKHHLSPEEKQKLQKAVSKSSPSQASPATGIEVELHSLYSYLVKKPAAEADKLIAFALSQPPPPQASPSQPSTPQPTTPVSPGTPPSQHIQQSVAAPPPAEDPYANDGYANDETNPDETANPDDMANPGNPPGEPQRAASARGGGPRGRTLPLRGGAPIRGRGMGPGGPGPGVNPGARGMGPGGPGARGMGPGGPGGNPNNNGQPGELPPGSPDGRGRGVPRTPTAPNLGRGGPGPARGMGPGGPGARGMGPGRGGPGRGGPGMGPGGPPGRGGGMGPGGAGGPGRNRNTFDLGQEGAAGLTDGTQADGWQPAESPGSPTRQRVARPVTQQGYQFDNSEHRGRKRSTSDPLGLERERVHEKLNLQNEVGGPSSPGSPKLLFRRGNSSKEIQVSSDLKDILGIQTNDLEKS